MQVTVIADNQANVYVNGAFVAGVDGGEWSSVAGGCEGVGRREWAGDAGATVDGGIGAGGGGDGFECGYEVDV